jgi:ATP-dependent RNA helicase DDX27
MEDDDERGDTAAIGASIRAAKKTQRPVRIGEAQPKPASGKKAAKQKKKAARVSGAGASFDRELGQKGAREGVRARKGDAIGGMGKKRPAKPAAKGAVKGAVKGGKGLKRR